MNNFKKFLFMLMIAFLSITFVAGPCFGFEIIRGDKAFAGKVRFLQDTTAKKNLTVEGSLNQAQYSHRFYVSSVTGANVSHYGKSYLKPFATITYALTKCTANKGDIIYILPDHTATIIGAGTITLNVAGVDVIGIGKGTLRPTITYTTAETACLMITGANTTLKNFIFKANFADILMAIDVDALDVRIEGCLFSEAATDMNFLSLIGTDDTNNAADGLTIIDNERISVDTGALAFVSILANIDRLKIIKNFDNQASAADVGHFLIMGSFDVLGAQIIGNILNLTGDNNAQTVGIFATGSSTSCTGVMAYNFVGSLDTTTELFDTATLDFQHFENYQTGTLNKSGTILPAIES
jgi:hypothetical protein